MTDKPAQPVFDAEAIAAARRLCEQATPGEWKWSTHGIDFLIAYERATAYPVMSGDDININPRNAQFIAQARTLLPLALGEIERLQNRERVLTSRIVLAEERVRILLDCYECLSHAHTLGHLGDGSTKAWAERAMARWRDSGNPPATPGKEGE